MVNASSIPTVPSSPALRLPPDSAALAASRGLAASALSGLAGGTGGANGDVAHVPTTRVTVLRGDTLDTLATSYETSRTKLLALNPHIVNANDLRAGDTLRVPTNRDVAQIAAGDTLGKLAATYGLTTDQMQRGNGIADASRIRTGQGFAPVPAREFGLATNASVRSYIYDVRSLEVQWGKLTPAQRLDRLGDAVNRQLIASGVPAVAVAQQSLGGANGQYDFATHTLQIERNLLTSPTIDAATFRDLADTLYHEGRHAEQWFDMARVAVARGIDPTTMSIKPSVVTAAQAAPAIDLKSEAGRFVNAMYESAYGTGSTHREATLSDTSGASYGDYRRLPEEADAWRVGGKVQTLWPR